jgi:hypothetical protein
MGDGQARTSYSRYIAYTSTASNGTCIWPFYLQKLELVLQHTTNPGRCVTHTHTHSPRTHPGTASHSTCIWSFVTRLGAAAASAAASSKHPLAMSGVQRIRRSSVDRVREMRASGQGSANRALTLLCTDSPPVCSMCARALLVLSYKICAVTTG